ncbi:hypothetical protein [Lacipirellula parvula]|uniref:Uncharacterized protein n=1 Tax=Lacipirellula parvula TaxID=2650471 RepID=A0A5K7XI59_9BACT|nr:hypothetical protein [Lacipirellula parvula]BBO36085.1 hypothetical protein PLANPX_5697 [Lacipirellula parvula]
MYCAECGTKGTGKFCTGCGQRLATAAGGQTGANDGSLPAPIDYDATVVLTIDWSDVIDYETLIAIPAVRDRIARASAQSKKRMTGEEILDLYGKALGKLAGVPLPLSMSTIAGVAQSTYAKLGVKTGKSLSGAYVVPVGEMLVRLLCSLAKEGRALRDVHQLSDGCIVRAALPSDLFALEGDVVVSVTRIAGGSCIEAATEIPGQMFDWGKSTRCLGAMLAELGAAAAA